MKHNPSIGINVPEHWENSQLDVYKIHHIAGRKIKQSMKKRFIPFCIIFLKKIYFDFIFKIFFRYLKKYFFKVIFFSNSSKGFFQPKKTLQSIISYVPWFLWILSSKADWWGWQHIFQLLQRLERPLRPKNLRSISHFRIKSYLSRHCKIFVLVARNKGTDE